MVDDPQQAYLDHQADPHIPTAVRHAMAEASRMTGDPDALHDWARTPALAIDQAREALAHLVGARPEEIIFTSGDTESRNLAVAGTVSARAVPEPRIVASVLEHPATLAAARSATRRGGRLDLIAPDAMGILDPDALRNAVDAETVLVCLTHGQAEIGTIADIPTATVAIRNGDGTPTIHVDAALTTGLLDLDVTALGADLVTLGGGPIGAPRWTGALWVAPGTRLHPLIVGGDQEQGKRGGHVNVPAVVGLGRAAELAAEHHTERLAALRARTARLAAGILSVDGVRLNGPPLDERLPGHLQVSVTGADSEALTLMLAVHGVAASPGSACTGAGKSSPVLEAIGLDDTWAHSAVLFTLAPSTSDAEVDHAIRAFSETVTTLRRIGVSG